MRKLKAKIQAQADEERDPFTTNELAAIFKAPLFTGCRSERNWKAPGNVIPRNSGKFWLPLVCLYTGMRSSAIIQLYTEDVKTEHGVLHFDVNKDGDDKRLKTAKSKRAIPMHSKLVKLGFLKHVERRRSEKSQRLFPDLKMGNDGYYSSPFSKFFGRFLTSVNVKRDKNAIHSFRHSFEDACSDSDEQIDTLQGRTHQGMATRYGKGHTLRKLGEVMPQLSYRDLDLTHLYEVYMGILRLF